MRSININNIWIVVGGGNWKKASDSEHIWIIILFLFFFVRSLPPQAHSLCNMHYAFMCICTCNQMIELYSKCMNAMWIWIKFFTYFQPNIFVYYDYDVLTHIIIWDSWCCWFNIYVCICRISHILHWTMYSTFFFVIYDVWFVCMFSFLYFILNATNTNWTSITSFVSDWNVLWVLSY